MSLKKHIVKNISFVTFAEVISNILSYFLIVLLARNLGAEQLGIYSFAFAFAGFFTFAYDFGISYFYVTSVSKDRANANKYIGQYASLKLIFCLLTLGLPMLSLLFMARGPTVNLIIFLAAISLFFQNYSYVARNTFSSFQQMKYEAAVRIAERAIAFAIGISVLLAGYGLMPFMIVLVISNAIATLYSLYLLRKLDVHFSLKIDVPMWKTMLKTSWTFWLSSVFIIIYFQVDTIMLTLMKGYEASGFYNAAYKLINVISKIPWILVFVLFPIMAEMHAKMSKKLLRMVLEKGMYAMAAVSFPLMVGATLIADKIILFMYEEGFTQSIIVLQILIWTTVFLFLGNMVGWFLNAIKKPHIFAYTTGICLFINVALNALLIPKFSYIGASAATVITAFVNFCLLYYYALKENYGVGIVRMCAKPILASAAMGAFIYFLGKDMNLFIVLPIAALIYFGALYLIGGIKKEDIKGIV